MKTTMMTKYLLLIFLAIVVAFSIGFILQDDMMGIITSAMMLIGMMTGQVYPYLLGIEIENRINFREQDGMGKFKSIVKGIGSLVVLIFVILGAVMAFSLLLGMNVDYNLEMTKPLTMLVAGLFTGRWMYMNKIGAQIPQAQ